MATVEPSRKLQRSCGSRAEDDRDVVDWSAGSYERTAAELEPVASAVVERAAVRRGEVLVDIACGTGNAALLAAARGARAVGIDGAARLIAVARERARTDNVEVDFRHGDLLDLPIRDDAADVVLSVFGVVFATDPGAALNETARVTRPGGRVLLTAWVPAGPIDSMLRAISRIMQDATGSSAPERFPWFDGARVGRLASDAGLTLESTTAAELAIRDTSPEAYVAAGQEHPVAVSARPALERAGIEVEVEAAMTAVLSEANEDADAFLVHSPYVVHELRAA
jgi:SAM-dependent methyltransferase